MWKDTFRSILCLLFIVAAAFFFPGTGYSSQIRQFTDMAGRTVAVPGKVDRVICSGAGSLRLLTYLKAHDRIVAVDSIELKGSPIDARPYAVANPQFKTYPLFGEFRGNPVMWAAWAKPVPMVSSPQNPLLHLLHSPIQKMWQLRLPEKNRFLMQPWPKSRLCSGTRISFFWISPPCAWDQGPVHWISC